LKGVRRPRQRSHFSVKDLFHREAKRSGIDGRISVEFWFDGVEIVNRGLGFDKLAANHLLDVLKILRAASLNLSQ